MEVKETQVQVQPTTNLSVQYSEGAVANMKAQREGLNKFISSQMRRESDFGVIPGTQKATLFKPGAEKLANLFQLGSRIVKQEKDIDHKNNFAMFSTTVEIFHIPSGKTISQCEGVCNSFEKKYKSRKIYEYNKLTKRREEVGEEQTPIGDVLNTLNKMSLKRAYVGAVIMATGASDFFTQDLDDSDEGGEPELKMGDKAPDFKPPTQGEQSAAGDFVIPFGRDAGIALKDMPTDSLKSSVKYWKDIEIKDKKPLKGKAAEFVAAAEAFLAGK